MSLRRAEGRFAFEPLEFLTILAALAVVVAEAALAVVVAEAALAVEAALAGLLARARVPARLQGARQRPRSALRRPAQRAGGRWCWAW